MKTIAARLYGKNDVRIEEFELPEIKTDEILARVVTDSLCMSTYKAIIQGEEHKRVPNSLFDNPIIIGHEFCGEIVEVGSKWKHKFSVGEKFVIQPALNCNGSLNAPGYSYEYIGGDSQYVIIPNEVMETDNLIKYHSDGYYTGSLSEPLSCIIGAFNASYHTKKGSYEHQMGCKQGGKMLILAGAGPMGIGAIDYALNGLEVSPSLLVVTDIDKERLDKARNTFDKKIDSKLVFTTSSSREELLELSDEDGYDDVFVFAPISDLVELGGKLLSKDGCLNFFAGPTNRDFCAKLNFYDVHYSSTHIVGTSGGNREDMIRAVELMNEGKLHPEAMVTHIGGLDSVIKATLNLPNIDGGKKLIYTGISLPLTKISEFESLSKENTENSDLFINLHHICKNYGGMWNLEAERYLLSHAKRLGDLNEK